MYSWELKNVDGIILAHSPTVNAALHTAKIMFGKIVAAKPEKKIITLYNEQAKICGYICKKSSPSDPYKKRTQTNVSHS